MKTLHPAVSRLVSCPYLAAVMALSVLSYTAVQGASAPSPRTKDSAAVATPALPAPPSDPYAAFLGDVATKSEACKTPAENLQTLLKLRADFVTSATREATDTRDKPAAELEELETKIATEELALRECHEKQGPAEAPPPPTTVARAKDGSVIPVEKLKETYFPPVPAAPPAIPVPPAPAGESAYIDFLAAQAGDSATFASMLEDLRALLEDRREAAVRYLSADDALRPFLASQIHALSQRIAETADGIQDGPATAEPTRTAGL